MKHFKHKLITLIGAFLCVITIHAQISISGVVKDAATNEEVIGAAVVERGTTNGTITDINGKFELRVASSASVLAISFVGYETHEVTVGSRTTFTIQLKEDAIQLGEIVAIGYGSQRRTDITGAVTSVSAENFNNGITSNPLGLIQGRVAGLNIIKDGGDDPANNSYNVQLRGVGSLEGSAQPLYVIDGVPGGNLASVNPNDIESITVLKDGSAAAIYGTRANAGVIIITTKRGKGTGTAFTAEYSGSVGTGFLRNAPRVLTAQEYRDKMVANGLGIDYGGNTNWLDAITRTPISHTHNLAVAGSTEKFNYRGSVGYRDMQGLAKKSDYEEINARFAANQKALNNMLDLAYDFGYTENKKTWANYDNFNQAIRSNPTMPIRSDDPRFEKYGGYYESDNFYTRNPVSDINQTTNDQEDQTMVGSIRGTLRLTDKFNFSTFYAIQNNSSWAGKYQLSTLREVQGQNGVAEQWQTNDKQRVIENTLQYVDTWKNVHNFQALLGQGYQTNLYRRFNAFNTNFPLDQLSYNRLGWGEGLLSGETSKANMDSHKYLDKLASYFARVMYNYDQRYFLSASIRFEGSSKFGAKAHPTLGPWGVFPAISGSWNIKRESFMQDVNSINDLRLRAGYGVTGNMPKSIRDVDNDMRRAGHYLYEMLVGPGDNYIFSDGAFIKPWGPISNVNEYLRWEEKHETNIGLDMAFLKSRLSFTMDGYFRNTKDLLFAYSVPVPPYPYGTKWDNYGVIHNYGLELLVNGVIIEQKDLSWSASFNAAWNRNKVVRITGEQYGKDGVEFFQNVGYISSGDGLTGVSVMRLAEGQPIGNFYGWKYYGINEKGEWVFKTPAGGYTTNPQESDKMILGNAQPDLIFGFNTVVVYKNFDFTLNFRGQIGGLIFNETRFFYENTRGVENALLSAFKGDAALLTAWKTSGSSNASIRKFSDFYLENASFFKLNDFTIGYTPKLSDSMKKYVNSVRLTLTAQNLFILTGYSGNDPSSIDMAGLEPGFDRRSYYPTQTSVIFGLSFKF